MKATFTLTYNPLDLDETDHVECFKNGPAYKSILCDLDRWLRGLVKYGFSEEKVSKEETYQEVRDYLWNLINEENVTLE